LNNIQIAPEAMKCLTTKFNLTQDQIRSVVIEAVDASIVDILTPVVDRSVTIALITTRELVLKDFAYDGNI
jgi:CCR4-NOT transcription complex subunit 1